MIHFWKRQDRAAAFKCVATVPKKIHQENQNKLIDDS